MNGRLNWFIQGLILFVGLICGQHTTAQVNPDAQKRYQAAVKLVQLGDYERAKADLNILIQQRGALAPFASYQYAIAAFRQKNYNQSRLMLKQLMELFPDWRKMDDASYLYAADCMEMGQYEDALSALQTIRDPLLRKDVLKLEQAFLPRVTDLSRLKLLNQTFPNDQVVGHLLIDLIQRTGTDKDDLELSDRLTNRFGVPAGLPARSTPVSSSTAATMPTTANAQPSRVSRPKGYYNVAVMFPFRVDEFSAEKLFRSNQYVYDLYNGIKMAKARLQDEGITVNLFAYDLDNDANKTLELVNSPAFSQTDLIIGPLYGEPNRIALAYASQNNIILLNPIATSSDLVVNQPLAFLAQPSISQQAHKAAEQVKNLIGPRKAAIYFGTSRKDSLLAVAYQAELKRQNYQVVDFRKVSGSVQAMADAMQFSGPAAVASTRPLSSTAPQPVVNLGHVFLASSNTDDGARLLDALSRRRVNGPLMATASAFDFYRNSSSTFTRRDLYLLYPDFIDPTREPVRSFQDDYLAKRNTIPSVFAGQGYDMMLFFGRQLARNGLLSGSRMNLYSEPDDYVLSGFDYTQSNDNQIVPIVKYDNGRFVKIN
ncbi:amino acid ABC transporter substrate-binding protein [Spirosoma aerophilum]